jgi:hypothetical protein
MSCVLVRNYAHRKHHDAWGKYCLEIRIRKVNLIRSAIFALLGAVAWWGTVTRRGDRGEQSFFAFLWALSVVGATGFLAIPLMQQISERSSRPDAADSPWPIVHGDYVARSSFIIKHLC